MWRKVAVSSAAVVAVAFPTVSVAPVASAKPVATVENGAVVVAPAAPARLKIARCTTANRAVTLTAKASKVIKGRTYGLEATRTVNICTTRTNATRVYLWSLVLKPVNGAVKVSASAGTTTKVVRNGVTTLTTPLTAKARFLFTTYRVTGTLKTVVDRYGKVTSQVVNVRQV